MATKRVKTVESEKLVLARAINQITKCRESFSTAVTNYQALEAEALRDLDMRIDTKRQELDEIDVEYEQKRKRAEVDFGTFMAEHRRRGALTVLEETGETPIDKDELDTLRSRLAELEASFQADVAEAKKTVSASASAQRDAALRTQQLEHQAKTAKLEAALEQKDAEIAVHKETIERMRADLQAQRELTADVTKSFAQASHNSHTIYAPPK